MANLAFIATSLDGYIADKNNEIDWLYSIPNPNNLDMGFVKHMQSIDALVMGRNTFELVLTLECEWPYSKPVFVLSNTLSSVPASCEGKFSIVKGDLRELTTKLQDDGYKNLYIDGGVTIQNFLKDDLIDEMIITTIPVLLGAGISLFGQLKDTLEFRCIKSEVFPHGISQSHFKRHRI
ncbi:MULTISPECIES: dihydrofolate reductase family protein [unclassified Pseudoalteromonas]|jgi:dihydrofolate reductase|uniref:dihydrofolate reductase family protein n=1 Tax=Pseudoalteromonas TaxID=53246 RepID=UPI0016008EF8|nr:MULTISPECIES: dihydrofolate reductase family protein [unclassified Pseudoalteromonas]MBB1301133.1 dihydrofolate reductase [Pseudoalteromonas sp. SR44-8]MBB1396995.1 dihydrofolate reductase [Pseudoalteromonas sp. SG44-8]MBB1408480.1 dihydrofolate reductase [Pseudoalteromonas sp. SG44-17]MBB1505382.1 dihydrofolate reductase [Pseudoalteromonas sp. SG41-1]